jgi:hypothetical protein
MRRFAACENGAARGGEAYAGRLRLYFMKCPPPVARTQCLGLDCATVEGRRASEVDRELTQGRVSE